MLLVSSVTYRPNVSVVNDNTECVVQNNQDIYELLRMT